MRLAATTALVLPAALALAALRAATDLVAASALLLTLGTLTASFLGIPRRPWVGFALFGWGYLVLAWLCPDELPTEMLLAESYPRFGRPAAPALDEPLPMRFPRDTPLADVIDYVKGCASLQFYLDPVGMQEAGRTEASTVRLDLDGVPLGESLALALGQLGLTYRVRAGYVVITADRRPDNFFRVGHCCFALLAGGVGTLAARRIDHLIRRPAPGPKEQP